MKERPILFSGPMVRAILADRKTQTRRVIKPQPIQDPDRSWRMEMKPRFGFNSEKTMRNNLPFHCPYGQPGDFLWVRETWLRDGDIYLYKADFGKGILSDSWRGRWKPSIHMPRKASRITLEIVNIRVERVQDISQADAKAEGILPLKLEDGGFVPLSGSDYVGAYRELWNELNADRGYGWNVNPWVWVIEFKRVEVHDAE